MNQVPDLSYSGRENLDAMKHAKNYNQYLIELIAQHAEGETILDFGAGAGTFAVPIAALKQNVVCVEPDAALQNALATARLQFYPGLGSVPLESLDSAYSLNVLEHIEDDYDVLVELGRRLRQGGKLLIYVPAFKLLFSAMDRHVGHFRRYRRARLEELLRQAGFEILFARYVDSIGFFVTLLYKLIGDRSGIISPRSVMLYDRLVFPLSKLADRVLGGLFGKNLVVVARKPARV